MNLPGFAEWLITVRPDLADRIHQMKQELSLHRNAHTPNDRQKEAAR